MYTKRWICEQGWGSVETENDSFWLGITGNVCISAVEDWQNEKPGLFVLIKCSKAEA